MRLTRKQLVVGGAGAALGAAGLYELVDQFTGGSPERANAAKVFPEQFAGLRVQRVENPGSVPKSST